MQPISEIQYNTLIQNDRVHATLYTDARIFEEELEKIFDLGF